MSSAPYTLAATPAREPLPVTGERQVAYLLLEVRPTPPAAAAPLNLSLVLDRSGSMSGPRLRNLKAAVARLIESLAPGDVLSVVTFDDTVERVIPAQIVGERRDDLVAAVNLIEDGGGTLMSLGMRQGLDEMRPFIAPERVSRMILLTDGVTREHQSQCRELASEAGAVGIPIVTLGFGAEWDDAQLDEIGRVSGGPPPEYIRTPWDVGPCFERQLQAARGVVARALHLEAHFVAGVTPRRVTHVAPYMRALDGGLEGGAISLALGELEREAHAVLIELIIEPKRGGTFRIAQAEARATGPDGASVSERMDVVVTFSASASKRPQVRPVVLHYVERANAARMILRALETPGAIAESSVALFDGESRDALEALRQGAPLSPEGDKSLRARVRDLGRGRRTGAAPVL